MQYEPIPLTPHEEILQRITALQAAMRKGRIEAILIVQRADLFYFAGTAQDAHLLVPHEGPPFLLVRKSFERAIKECPLDSVRHLKSLSDLKTVVLSVFHGSVSSLGMELDVLPVNNYRIYEELFPKTKIQDVSQLIREIRMVKSSYEIGLVREAARMNDSMFTQVKQILKEGMSEIELAGQIEAYCRSQNHQGYCRVRGFNQEVFYGHIMSGSNLAVPSCSLGPTGGPGPNPSMPQGAGIKTVQRHEPVQIDYLGVLNGYMVDQARTFFIGEPPSKFLKIHSVSLAIQSELMSAGVPGARSEKLYEIALEIARQADMSEGFMGYPQPVPFVGHGIGLEVDELPVIGRKSPHILKNGMIIALEPKFIVPGEGLAGLENTFLVTEHGLEKLTQFDDAIHVLS